jgi:hypothetical protein
VRVPTLIRTHVEHVRNARRSRAEFSARIELPDD